MKELMQDPGFFYALAFIIFMALAFIYARKPALGWLDGEIAKIRTELDQAYQLRAEAEAALADCKAKQVRAEADAKTIVTMAQQQVDSMRKQAERDLAASLARHERMAADRIRMAEAEAIADVRKAAIELAMKLARQSLENLPEGETNRLADEAIGEIPALRKLRA